MSEYNERGERIRGYDRLGYKRKEPKLFPWPLLMVIGIVLGLAGGWII